MLTVDDNNWNKIDKNLEENKNSNIRFVRHIGYRPVGISCSLCKSLIATVEDVETMKEADICENCYITHYYHNKVRWKKRWRPNIKR